VPTVAVVIEVVSPDDETYEKFGFYAAHAVDELVIANPATRGIQCWKHGASGYIEAAASELLAISVDTLTQLISWP